MRIKNCVSIVVLGSLATATTVRPAQEMKQKFVAAQKANGAAARQYTWTSRNVKNQARPTLERNRP
jgi:hypothetical protein